MYTLGSYETNAPHLRFFHKESTDVAPFRFKSAMCLSNLFLYKATFTVGAEILCAAAESKILETPGSLVTDDIKMFP
jgi:hypothetical protein